MATKKYLDNYADKWKREDFQARIYEVLLDSYEQSLDDHLAKGNYSSEEEDIYIEDERNLLESGNLTDNLIDVILEKKTDFDKYYDEDFYDDK
jgi:hypothetical protein